MNSANEIWMSITPVLQEKFTEIAFKTWFGQVEALDFKMDQLTLSCPSDFKAKMIRDRFLSDIEQILHDLFAADIKAVILRTGGDGCLPLGVAGTAGIQPEHPDGQ